jgi:2-iminoacetate synthase
MTFNDILQTTDLPALRRRMDQTQPREVERVLGAGAADFHDFLTLISPAATHYLEPLAQLAHRISLQRFGRVILLYAPLYLSNECTNACQYCGFNLNRTLPRITLTSEEILAEAKYLHDVGFRHLLLVCGEAPKVVPVAALETALDLLKDDFASLSLEVYPLSGPGYMQVAAAGADGLTLYQETYDRETYARVHPAGRKRDYDWRLEAVERAGEAGLRRLGIGVLLGLHDWRSEALCLALHADYLMKRFWQSQISLSFPRLRHTPDTFTAPHPVNDAELVQLMLALRVFLPDAGMVLSTREPASLRDRLIPLGVTQMSAGSRTEPGGYLHPVEAGSQFSVEDQRTPQEVANVIRQSGYEPAWKDWDSQMHEGIQYANNRQRNGEGHA